MCISLQERNNLDVHVYRQTSIHKHRKDLSVDETCEVLYDYGNFLHAVFA